jgi:hypothetical protein
LDEPSLKVVGRFAWGNYRQGGMVMLSQILVENPPVGVDLLLYDNFEIMKALCLADIANCVVYLQFVRFSLSIYRTVGRPSRAFEVQVAKIGLETLNRWTEDAQNGQAVALNCIQLLNELDAEVVKEAFMALGISLQRAVVTATQKQISKIETRNKIRDLKTFSTATRKGHDEMDDGDWQSLDGD